MYNSFPVAQTTYSGRWKGRQDWQRRETRPGRRQVRSNSMRRSLPHKLMPSSSVLLSFQYCEKCRICKNGHPASCKTWTALNFGRLRADGSDTNADLNGKRIHGTFFGQSAFSKHALVVESSVTKVPTDTDLVLMSPLGCAMQTGSGAVLNGG